MTERAHHSYSIRIFYEDTDAAGIVYYANYLKFAERGRTEMLRDSGYDHARMGRDHGLFFAVRRCNADYRKPALLDDLIQVETTVASMKGASLQVRQEITRDGELLVGVDVTLACLSMKGNRPSRIPQEVVQAVADYRNEDAA